MNKHYRFIASILLGCLIASGINAADGKPTIVNGHPISEKAFRALINQQLAQGASDSPELKSAAREELISREVISQEAKRKGLDKTANGQGELELAQQAALVRIFANDYQKSHPISDAAAKAEYDRIKNSLGGIEYKSRHILVSSEEEAKVIIAKLDKGEKFAELAKQSKDQGSREKGGELNWSAPSVYVKPFADALTKLKNGEYTKTPVKSDYGYHVIQREDSRPLTSPPFEQVSTQIKQRMSQAEIEKVIKELRAKAKIQ